MNKAKIIEISKELFPTSKPRHYLTEGQRMGFQKGCEFMLVKNPIVWLQDNKRFISIRAIEQELNMPDSTLIKAVNESQSLSKKWVDPLKEFINDLIKS